MNYRLANRFPKDT